MFLPSITPVEESVQLLEPAYHALLVLGDTLYKKEHQELEEKEREGKVAEMKSKEMKFWDRVLQKGVLMGYAHANEYPSIAEILLRNLGLVSGKMGIYAVKHLKVCSH